MRAPELFHRPTTLGRLLFLALAWGLPICGLFLIVWATLAPRWPSEANNVLGTKEITDPRLLVGIAILALWGAMLAALWAVRYFERRKQRKLNERMTQALRHSMSLESSNADGLSHEERMRRRWKEDVHERLRQKGYDYYTIPFYLIIGASQSGKTTAIGESGLEFPIGPKPVEDYAGTKDCKWFFTNDGVIIDTAGRYVESLAPNPGQAGVTPLAEESRKEWTAFLEMLRRERARAPINGVLLAIRVPDLVEPDPKKRARLVVALRTALLDIEEKLGVRVPVYLLVTMSDLVPGFVEYFDHMVGADRSLFGWTDERPISEAYSRAKLEQGLNVLARRVEDLALGFYASDLSQGSVDEAGQQKIDRASLFPEEFRSLHQPLLEIIDRLFEPNRFHELHRLRGVYFTSGTQGKGRLVARAAQDLFGPGMGGLGVAAQTAGRTTKSYFIADLFREVVFKESGLVAQSKRAHREVVRRRRITQAVAAAAGILLLVQLTWNAKDAFAATDLLVRSTKWNGMPDKVSTVYQYLGMFDSLGAKRSRGRIADAALFLWLHDELKQWLEESNSKLAVDELAELEALVRWLDGGEGLPPATSISGARFEKYEGTSSLRAEFLEGNEAENCGRVTEMEVHAWAHRLHESLAVARAGSTPLRCNRDAAWGHNGAEQIKTYLSVSTPAGPASTDERYPFDSNWARRVRLMAGLLRDLAEKEGGENCPLQRVWETKRNWLDRADALASFNDATIEASCSYTNIGSFKTVCFAWLGSRTPSTNHSLKFDLGGREPRTQLWSHIKACDAREETHLELTSYSLTRVDFLKGLYSDDGVLTETGQLPERVLVKQIELTVRPENTGSRPSIRISFKGSQLPLQLPELQPQ